MSEELIQEKMNELWKAMCNSTDDPDYIVVNPKFHGMVTVSTHMPEKWYYKIPWIGNLIYSRDFDIALTVLKESGL
ncbi:hypothetical protein OAF54_03200 [bacterium]|nr:hypothetical protein [bacterium]